MPDTRRYSVVHRYQDSGWGATEFSHDRLADALIEAGACASDAIRYGMGGVYDNHLDYMVATFPAGVDPLTATKIGFEALQREEDKEDQRRKGRLAAAEAAKEPPKPDPYREADRKKEQSAIPPTEADELSKEIKAFVEKLGSRFKGLESVSVTLAWKEGVGPLLGGWSAVDGATLRQAGVYRLINILQQMNQQATIYQQMVASEIQELNKLIANPTNEPQTTGPGPEATNQSVGTNSAVGTGSSSGGELYPRLYTEPNGIDHQGVIDGIIEQGNDEDGFDRPVTTPRAYNPWFGPNDPHQRRS
jgi:hypothetical protein